MGKSKNRAVGDRYEEMTTDWMKKNGYKILERNWTAPPHELDIIALKDSTIVFTEVKSGNEKFFESPEARIDLDKMRFLISAAKKYIASLKKHRIDTDFFDYRFDASAITFNDDSEVLAFTYYENYFEPGSDFPE